MATQVLLPKHGTTDAAGAQKKAAAKNGKTESYVIYSIYYNDQPERGYVIYSSNQNGWQFFDHLPAKQPTLVTELVPRKIDLL